jgi:hypothetical protein
MFLRAIAILVAPVPLAFFYVATTPSDAQVRPLVLWAGYYLIAHLFFWPPLLVTRYLARRIPLNSLFQVAAVMAVCSIAISSAVAILLVLLLNWDYTWRAGLRDALAEALASVGSLWLYGAILGLGRPLTIVGGVRESR